MFTPLAALHGSKHLDESEIGEPERSCSFCGGLERRRICDLQVNPTVSLLQCATCHASSASRMPTSQALDAYYGTYYDERFNPGQVANVTFDEPDRMAKQLASAYHRWRGVSGTVTMLDYGGGDGTFAYLTAKRLIAHGARHVHVDLCDYSANLIANTESRIELNKLSTLPNDRCEAYSYVIASAVIEHVPNAGDLLRELLSRVEMGGMFYARTPWMAPLANILGRLGKRLDFTYPAHVHDLGRVFWEKWFASRGMNKQFRILASRPSIVATTPNIIFRERA